MPAQENLLQKPRGKDGLFHSLLEDQASVAVRAAQAFVDLVGDIAHIDQHVAAIAQIEHDGDELTHQLQNMITTTFMTPLDKEDLRDLSQALDDITDYIEAAAARTQLYKLREARPDLLPLAKQLQKAAETVLEAVHEIHVGFHRSQALRPILRRIHEIENDSDKSFRTALARLFEEPTPEPLMVIKWKEIYDRIETAVDKCEDIAKIIGTIAVKYA